MITGARIRAFFSWLTLVAFTTGQVPIGLIALSNEAYAAGGISTGSLVAATLLASVENAEAATSDSPLSNRSLADRSWETKAAQTAGSCDATCSVITQNLADGKGVWGRQDERWCEQHGISIESPMVLSDKDEAKVPPQATPLPIGKTDPNCPYPLAAGETCGQTGYKMKLCQAHNTQLGPYCVAYQAQKETNGSLEMLRDMNIAAAATCGTASALGILFWALVDGQGSENRNPESDNARETTQNNNSQPDRTVTSESSDPNGNSTRNVETRSADGSTTYSNENRSPDGSSSANFETHNADGTTTTGTEYRDAHGNGTRTYTTTKPDGTVVDQGSGSALPRSNEAIPLRAPTPKHDLRALIRLLPAELSTQFSNLLVPSAYGAESATAAFAWTFVYPPAITAQYLCMAGGFVAGVAELAVGISQTKGSAGKAVTGLMGTVGVAGSIAILASTLKGPGLTGKIASKATDSKVAQDERASKFGVPDPISTGISAAFFGLMAALRAKSISALKDSKQKACKNVQNLASQALVVNMSDTPDPSIYPVPPSNQPASAGATTAVTATTSGGTSVIPNSPTNTATTSVTANSASPSRFSQPISSMNPAVAAATDGQILARMSNEGEIRKRAAQIDGNAIMNDIENGRGFGPTLGRLIQSDVQGALRNQNASGLTESMWRQAMSIPAWIAAVADATYNDPAPVLAALSASKLPGAESFKNTGLSAKNSKSGLGAAGLTAEALSGGPTLPAQPDLGARAVASLPAGLVGNAGAFADANDEFHANDTRSIFDIVSKRIDRSRDRVVRLEWAMPMNKAMHR